MIISRTPLRVSFFGGGSDLPAYYRRHGGAVLSTAIDKSVYVTVSRKFDAAVRVSYSRTEEVERAADVEHPLVREALGLLGIEGGVEITSVADIPARGTGLGSSSAFTVGLLNALHAYQGRHAPAARLAEESCHIEIERCGEPIGKQDQYAAAFGGFNFIRFHADDRVEVTKVVCPADVTAELQRRLLFFYTGVTRSASALLGDQSAAVAKPGAAASATGELSCLAGQAFEAVCNGDLEPLGPMLDAAWRLKKGLAAGVSNGLIDDAYATARGAGAEGGKLLGAGGGGFLMFLAPPERHDAIRSALGALRETPFRFAGQGSSIDPFYLTWKSREFDMPTRFIELAGEINLAMPRYVIGRLEEALDERLGKSLSSARVLIVGLAYKKNVADVRESPTFKLMELLEKRGAAVSFHDPYVEAIPPTREHAAFTGRRSTPITRENILAHDAVLISTDHDGIDYELIAGNGETPVIIDARNAFARRGIGGANIIKA